MSYIFPRVFDSMELPNLRVDLHQFQPSEPGQFLLEQKNINFISSLVKKLAGLLGLNFAKKISSHKYSVYKIYEYVMQIKIII